MKYQSIKFSNKQIEILKYLFEKDYLQNELQDLLTTTAPNLYYHLNKLQEQNLIRKETLYQIGNAKSNKVSLIPAARQFVRKLLGFKVKDYTLITGFGVLKTGYRIPDEVYRLLKSSYHPISRIICFTSEDAILKREEHKKEEQLIEIDKYYTFNYEDFRNIHSDFFKNVETMLSKEIQNANIIIDLTPLSKFYSFKLLELANKYQLPCIYCGTDTDNNYKLFSMSKIKIEGAIKPFS